MCVSMPVWTHAQLLRLCPTFCDPTDFNPARLFCPWDSPGKNTGVGCHALLVNNYTSVYIYIFVSESESGSVVSDSLQSHGPYTPWNSPGWNTGVVAFPFSGGIFPTQGLNPGLPHCRQILYQLSRKGKPFVSEVTCFTTLEGKLLLVILLLDLKYLFNDRRT